jgi:uncharacterized protein
VTETIYRPGQFVWREMLTPDTAQSVRFYGEVIGWKTEVADMPAGGTYTMFKVDDRRVGGCMKLPMPGIPPHWSLYVSADDVDATAKLATTAGGNVVAGPMDAGGMGRFATLIDPQGAAISLWHGKAGDGARNPERASVGEFCWEQLNTSDPKAAATFYNTLFGWTDAPFGAGGGMNVFSAGDVQVASRMQAPPGSPSHWLTYVIVDGLSSANARVEKHGGKVMVAKIDIPTVGAISVIQDNVGAYLGLFENPKA